MVAVEPEYENDQSPSVSATARPHRRRSATAMAWLARRGGQERSFMVGGCPGCGWRVPGRKEDLSADSHRWLWSGRCRKPTERCACAQPRSRPFCVKWTRFPVNDDLRVQIVWCRTRSSFGCSPQVSGGTADGDVGPVAARQGRRIAEGAEARQVRNNWRGRPRQARPSRARPGDDTTESTDTIESTESRFGRLKDAKRKGDRLGRVGRASSRSKGADG